MIKFFRKIRQQLLGEGNTAKYFKYAIGEILLVMIGILLALQVNNWNEERKIIKNEKETIKSLKLEFEKNHSTLQGNIRVLQRIIETNNILLSHVGPDYELGTIHNVDSLISMTLRMTVWDPSQYTLNSMKSEGKLSSLSNENLKVKLIEWESFYSNLLDWGDFYVDGGAKYFDFLKNNSLYRNISFRPDNNTVKSKFEGSNDELLRVQLFENFLIDRATISGFMLDFYKEAEQQIIEIIHECQTYED